MKPDTLVESVGSKWQTEFEQFVETGDATPEFLEYLDRDQGAQAAVERAFTEQAAALEDLAKTIRQGDGMELASQQATGLRPSDAMARAVQRVAILPAIERKQAVSEVAKALTKAAGNRVREVRAMLSDLVQDVATLSG